MRSTRYGRVLLAGVVSLVLAELYYRSSLHLFSSRLWVPLAPYAILGVALAAFFGACVYEARRDSLRNRHLAVFGGLLSGASSALAAGYYFLRWHFNPNPPWECYACPNLWETPILALLIGFLVSMPGALGALAIGALTRIRGTPRHAGP
jgi:hypothetical protein